jgi:hypothetical protein
LERRGAGTTPASNRIELAWLFAVVLVFWLFRGHAFEASRVLDGHRVFLLDDDQMISMRYARHLAEGRGLVWNDGEHVEGYTNFGWTLVMAALNLIVPLPPERMSLAVELVAAVCVAATLRPARALAGELAGRELGLGATALLYTGMVTSVDAMFWPASGFETGLLALLVTLACLALASDAPPPPWFYGVLAALPLVRADALVLAGTLAAAAWLRAADRRHASLRLAAAALPAAAHLVWRRA